MLIFTNIKEVTIKQEEEGEGGKSLWKELTR